MSRNGDNPNERTPLQAALAYASAGWPVFPVATGSKVPAFPSAHPPGSREAATCQGQCGQVGHGFKDATTDPDLIRSWWGRCPQWNVGIATGAPGPDVLDIDVKPDGSGFAALNRIKRAGLADGQQAIVRTPSTGMHLYYAGTDQSNGADRENHIDFRSRGGYVVAPPSVTPAGGYVVVQHRPSQDATLDWGAVREVLHAEALRRQQAMATQHQAGRQAGQGDAGRVDRLARFVAEGREGDRNFRVFYAAKQLGLSGQLDDAATERLVDAALAAGLRGGEREARRSIASGQQDAMRTGGGNGAGRGRERAAEAGGERRPFGTSRDAGHEAV
jgi:hypothetical protein